MDNNKENHYVRKHQFIYTEKKWYEHIKDYLKILITEVPAFIALVVSLWVFTEILMEITDNRVSINKLFLLITSIAFIAIAYKSFVKYSSKIPEILNNESNASKNIIWWQKCGWQYDLAYQILNERFQKIEFVLNRIASGANFLPPKSLPIESYIEWLNSRPLILSRLIKAVEIQCIQELPKTLGKTKNESDLKEILIGLENLVELYEFAKDFEVECHQIIPPPQFESVHKMTFGWTDPIRNGINEFLGILKGIANYDIKSKTNKQKIPFYNIEINSPTNIDEFCKRLESIDTENL